MANSSFQEACDFLYSLRNRGSKYGLDRMVAVCELIGDPQFKFPSIHIAGTNGKGSTAAILESIYRASGLKVGLFTSPHLVYLGERIQINREPIDQVCLLDLISRLRNQIEATMPTSDENYPSFFEFITALAFEYFAENKVDLAIFETGLGGRLDSTNVLLPDLSIITSIGLDHCEILGNDIPTITREKAGIIKEGIPVVVGNLEDSALEVMGQVAKAQGASISLFRDRWPNLELIPECSLQGVYQKFNTGLAIMATECLKDRFSVSPVSLQKGLNTVEWGGRWHEIVLDDGRSLVLEATHNGEGAKMLDIQLESWVQNELNGLKPEVVFGCTSQSRLEQIIPILEKYAENLHIVVPDQPNACSFEEVKAAISANFGGDCYLASIDRLFSQGNLCHIPGERAVLCTGSLYLIGEVIAKLGITNSSSDCSHESLGMQDLR